VYLDIRLEQVFASRSGTPVEEKRDRMKYSSAHALAFLLWVAVMTGVSCPSMSRAGDGRPNLYLLAVGVSTYRDGRVPDLVYADDDARAMAAWAESQRQHLYGEVFSMVLTDRDASRERVIKAISTFFKPARSQDQLILFLSGHGLVEPDTGSYHFLTLNTAFDNIEGTALEQTTLFQLLEPAQRRRGRLLVLVDSCQAGKLAEAIPSDGKGVLLARDQFAVPDDPSGAVQKLRAVFTAGMVQDKAIEGPQFRLSSEPESIQGHGVFTWAVLKALWSTEADLGKDGIVDSREFFEYVTRAVRQAGNGQAPVFNGQDTGVELAFAVGTREICDNRDNDLDGLIDEDFPDNNGNGLADCLEREICNGRDDNGDGRIDEGFDRDSDGHNAIALCGSTWGDDCDDNDITVHPGQKDWGNLRDDDCDSFFDEDDALVGDLPRSLMRHDRNLKTWRTASLGAGIVFAVVGTVAYALLAPVQHRDPNVFEVDPEALGRSVVYSRVAVGSWGIGAAGLSLGVSLEWKRRRFRVDFFPARREHRLDGVAPSAGPPG
jgi:hypothetical protein